MTGSILVLLIVVGSVIYFTAVALVVNVCRVPREYRVTVVVGSVFVYIIGVVAFVAWLGHALTQAMGRI